jgi:trigger factor
MMIAKMAETYGMKAEDLEKNVSDDDRENLKADLRIQKAVDLIMENAKERKKPVRKAKKDDAKEETTEE